MCDRVLQLTGHQVGSDPPLFWTGWLGHWTGLRPADMADLTVQQYVEAVDWIQKQNRD